MNFAVGVLELLGYLVPGAMVVSVALLVRAAPRVDESLPRDSTIALAMFLLASYVGGHVLTVVSRALDWIHVKVRGHRPRAYSFYPDLQQHLKRTFGQDLGSSEQYHFSRQLAMEHCPRAAERIERLFTMALLTRNLAVASLACALRLACAGRLAWGAGCGVLAALFAFQHYRFDDTEQRAVFRAAYLAFTMPAPAPGKNIGK